MPGHTIDRPESALHYLLEMSADIRAAYLVSGGELTAAAPDDGGRVATDVERFAELAISLRVTKEDPLELDALSDRDLVLAVVRGSSALVCVADRTALPGIVLHEMRSTLDDLGVGVATDGKDGTGR